MVVVGQHVFVVADQCQAPSGLAHGHVGHMAKHVVEGNMHHAMLAARHGSSQCNDVGVFHGIGSREDGFLEEQVALRMNEIASYGPQQHVVGAGVGVMGGQNGLAERLEREVYRDNAFDAVAVRP